MSAFDSELLGTPAEGLSRRAPADVVRRFPNVKTVDDKPAAEFWKPFDAKK